jgi:site-specific DNA-methyltransferase (adenine-specific)
MVFHGDALQLLDNLGPEIADHIITDPPYAIDMSMLQQPQHEKTGVGIDVSSTEAEHQVADNIRLLEAFVPLAYRALKPNGFCIIWTDPRQETRLYNLAIATGFKPQRWPLIWYKTSPCINQAASYNFTKNYEIAIVLRKGNATLLTPQSSSVFVGPNDGEAKSLGHPFTKPFWLWEKLFAAVAQRGQTVLDPFAGSGSSTIAALRYGLSPIAIEINENHYASLVVNVSDHYRTVLSNPVFV